MLLPKDRDLGRTKVHLMAAPNSAFFSHCCLSMEHVWDETLPTAATDGMSIFYNSAYFEALDSEERVGLMLHETLHPAMLHFERMGTRDPRIWNEAGDYSINLIIIEAGFKLPKGALYDTKYTNWSVERIYDDLSANPNRKKKLADNQVDMKKPGKPGDAGAQAPSAPGQTAPPAAPTKGEIKAHWDEILVQASVAARVAQQAGSVPNSIQLYIDSLLKPEVKWNRILSAFMTKLKKTSYTFRKPNRRYRPMILPSQFGEAICDIMVAVDTSGSVTQKQFHHFISEVAAIMKNMRPDKITFMCFDTAIKSTDELHNLKDLRKVTFTGRGGTRIDPVMAVAQKTKPACLIVFTDGHYTAPKINPKVPVLWIVNNNKRFSCKFGKTITYNFKEAA